MPRDTIDVRQSTAAARNKPEIIELLGPLEFFPGDNTITFAVASFNAPSNPRLASSASGVTFQYETVALKENAEGQYIVINFVLDYECPKNQPLGALSVGNLIITIDSLDGDGQTHGVTYTYAPLLPRRKIKYQCGVIPDAVRRKAGRGGDA